MSTGNSDNECNAFLLQKNVDIILFPESTLTTDRNGSLIPDPAQKVIPYLTNIHATYEVCIIFKIYCKKTQTESITLVCSFSLCVPCPKQQQNIKYMLLSICAKGWNAQTTRENVLRGATSCTTRMSSLTDWER